MRTKPIVGHQWSRFVQGDWDGFSGCETFEYGEAPLIIGEAPLIIEWEVPGGGEAAAIVDKNGMQIHVACDDSVGLLELDTTPSKGEERAVGRVANAMFVLASRRTDQSDWERLGFVETW